MGIFALLFLGMGLTALVRVLIGRLPPQEELEPGSSGPPMSKDARRAGSAMQGLTSDLTFLGGQAGWQY